MNLLLDTHALIWAVENPAKLGSVARPQIEDPSNTLLLRSASIWELAIKVSLGKLTLTLPFEQWITVAMRDLDIVLLPITVEHTVMLASLPWHHRDPFDRMLAAQSQIENIPIISNDRDLEAYGISKLW
ncbi:MAG: type II toxin-antitoxin system VapC family toxin [Planctomycetes bacterium]|nr:type II toxin-antitoxin system VapC family toxin [Planctomycetota bacterium]